MGAGRCAPYTGSSPSPREARHPPSRQGEEAVPSRQGEEAAPSRQGGEAILLDILPN